ncbi:MAG TPA: helix-turn-helix transcriptional regulator [Flavipsychrobacter sp.]|nr:helix-turn-helix transcriptional regulator [Flavipsychrobacter sp.]
MNKEQIGNIIQIRREKLALKQEDLSEMTGLTTKTIYLIENGIGNPSLSTLKKILEVLGLEITVDIKKVE